MAARAFLPGQQNCHSQSRRVCLQLSYRDFFLLTSFQHFAEGFCPLKQSRRRFGSFFCAVSGSYLAGYQMYIIPDSFGFHQSITIQMFSLVGGLDYFLLGPILGAAIMTFVPEYLNTTSEFEPILTAVVIIFIIIFMPFGVSGFLKKCWKSPFSIRIRNMIIPSKLKIVSEKGWEK